MINVNMTGKAGVTLATAGKYCADSVKVTPSAEILRKDEQAKSATPTETAQDITPDSGKVLSKVSVGAIPKTYVGSGVTKKAAATVSPSTSEQTVCASGVYTTGAQKVSAITPSIVGNLDASSFAASIVAAIEGKGVTVPDGTLLDGMAALIDSIEAGGGGFENIQTVTGSFTPDSLISIQTQEFPGPGAFTVEHNAGFIPRAAIAYTGTYGTSKLTLYAAIVNGLYGDAGYTISTYSVHQYYSNKKYTNESIIKVYESKWNDAVFTMAHSNNKSQLSSGTTVNWVVFS